MGRPRLCLVLGVIATGVLAGRVTSADPELALQADTVLATAGYYQLRWDESIELQTRLTEQRLLDYRQSVLKALEEVQGALVAYNNEHERLAALRQATEATREGVRLAMVQYDTGLTDYNNVMTMQRDLFQLEEQLAASEAQVDFQLIALYKAVGGGW